MDALFLPLLAGCLVALLSALSVVLVRRPVYAAISLLVHSLSLAALFAILAAGLVAVGQIIIYSGAIVVLFLFVVTLLPTGGTTLAPTISRLAAALAAGAALLAAFAAVLATTIPTAVPTADVGVPEVGHALFGPLILSFELTVPLLLVAIVGAVVLWRRHEPHVRTAPPPPRESSTPRRVVLHQ